MYCMAYLLISGIEHYFFYAKIPLSPLLPTLLLFSTCNRQPGFHEDTEVGILITMMTKTDKAMKFKFIHFSQDGTFRSLNIPQTGTASIPSAKVPLKDFSWGRYNLKFVNQWVKIGSN